MRRVLNLGKLFGIHLRLHFSWFIIFILVNVMLVYPDFSNWLNWLVGISISILLFTSVVVHELAHSLVGKVYGVPVDSITLFIFGGVARMTKEPEKPGTELKMVIAGPLCSLVISSLFFILWTIVPDNAGPFAVIFEYLCLINVSLALFNMIPGFPLDGGRILRSILWKITGNYQHSTRVAARLGQGTGILFIASGLAIAIIQPLELDWFNGLWIMCIGWFLTSNATASYKGVTSDDRVQKTLVANPVHLYQTYNTTLNENFKDTETGYFKSTGE